VEGSRGIREKHVLDYRRVMEKNQTLGKKKGLQSRGGELSPRRSSPRKKRRTRRSLGWKRKDHRMSCEKTGGRKSCPGGIGPSMRVGFAPGEVEGENPRLGNQLDLK